MDYKSKIASELAFKRKVKEISKRLVDKDILHDKAWLDSMIDGNDRLAQAMKAFHCSILQQLAEDVRNEVERLDVKKEKRLDGVLSMVYEALGGTLRHPTKTTPSAWKRATSEAAMAAMECKALDSDFPGWR